MGSSKFIISPERKKEEKITHREWLNLSKKKTNNEQLQIRYIEVEGLFELDEQ